MSTLTTRTWDDDALAVADADLDSAATATSGAVDDATTTATATATATRKVYRFRSVWPRLVNFFRALSLFVATYIVVDSRFIC